MEVNHTFRRLLGINLIITLALNSQKPPLSYAGSTRNSEAPPVSQARLGSGSLTVSCRVSNFKAHTEFSLR